MTERMKLGTVVLAIAVVLALVFLNSWRAHRSFEALLEEEGFEPASCGTARIVVRDKDLQDMKCWRGPLTASVTGEIVTGYIPSFKKSDYLYFLGVVVTPSATIDEAWLHGWAEQDTFHTLEGRYAVMWNLMDTRSNLDHVLAALRARLPS